MKSKRTDRLLSTLTPEAREVISELLEVGYKAGLNPQVHSAYRSPAEQDKLYAMGRSRPGKVVTNARGTPVPQSSHCYRVAVDIHFDNDKDGRAEWDMELYRQLWELGCEAGLEEKGLRWAGNWRRFKEGPHYEVTFGRSWRELAVDYNYAQPYPGYKPLEKPEPKKKEKKKEPEGDKKQTAPKRRTRKKPTKKEKVDYNGQCLISDFDDPKE